MDPPPHRHHERYHDNGYFAHESHHDEARERHHLDDENAMISALAGEHPPQHHQHSHPSHSHMTPGESDSDLNLKKGIKRTNGSKSNAESSDPSMAHTRKDGEVKYDKDGNPKKKRKQVSPFPPCELCSRTKSHSAMRQLRYSSCTFLPSLLREASFRAELRNLMCRACDSCRLRRVKCDRAEKMGGPCSECEKKKITCASVSSLLFVRAILSFVRGPLGAPIPTSRANLKRSGAGN